VKTTIADPKCSLDEAEERTRQLNVKAVELSQSEQQKEKRMKKK